MDKEIRILLVEDSEDDAELIQRGIDKGNFAHTAKWVRSRDEFLKSLREFIPDVILCDYKLPSLTAPEALEIVKARFPEVPFIVISGTIGEEMAVEMIKSGVVDYVMKDNLVRLVPAIKRAVKEAEVNAERVQLKIYQDIGLEVLQILNEPRDLQNLIPQVLDIFKTRIGLDAVGMRLRQGNDFPYFAQQGFSKDFLLTENTLAERNSDGGVCHDANGNISLECTCGLVLSGKTDPSNPLFTRGGSFWVNDSFPLLKLPPDQDPRKNPRNQCIHLGYASVALIPIRMKNQIVGLLQFNDHRKNRFSLVSIEQIESIAAHIGETLVRKQTEETIRKNEERLKDIISNMADWVWEVDKNGIYTYSSDKVSDILGISAKEVIGKTPFDFMSPEEAKRVEAICSKIAADKAPIKDLLNWNIGTSGKKVCLLTNAVPLLDPEGNLQGYRGVDKDITEQKNMEDSLRQSEEKYRGMVDNISIGVALISPEMEILFLNNQMKKWNPHINLKNKHICYRSFNNPPREEACAYCPTAKTLKDGLVHSAVTETPMNGKIFNYKIISSPIKDEKGRVVTAIEMVEDITEQKQAEQRLRESHSLLSSLADQSPGALYQFKMSQDGRFSLPFASTKIVHHFGLTPEELREDAAKLFKVIHPEDLESILTSIRESARTLTTWSHEFRVILPDGTITWEQASSTPERLPDNSILWHGFIWDITERKHAEDMLRSKTALLEAQANSTIDGILIIDENQKRILINQRFVDLVKAPESVLTDQNDSPLLQHVMNLTKYPDKFLEKVTYLNSHPTETSRDEIEFKNGMVLDRYSAPVVGKDGKHYGRIWTFRDITERKKLEREAKRRLEELEVFHRASVGREERILELKRKVDELKRALEK